MSSMQKNINCNEKQDFNDPIQTHIMRLKEIIIVIIFFQLHLSSIMYAQVEIIDTWMKSGITGLPCLEHFSQLVRLPD